MQTNTTRDKTIDFIKGILILFVILGHTTLGLTDMYSFDDTMSFNFYNKQGAIQTKDYYFEAVNKTDSSVTMRLAADNASYIDFIYTLKPNSYLMNFEIKATGMEGKLDRKSVV